MYTPQRSPNAWLLVRELIFEQVRIGSFPHKPSRFDCTFVCLSEADLLELCAASNRYLDLKYEVELVQPDLPNHLGDWTLANMDNGYDCPIFENRAGLYWQGNNPVKQELLTQSSLRIIRVL
jgi:hypothetical protein